MRGIFNDTKEQGAVSPDEVKYASSVMPSLFQNGVRAMAMVMPKKSVTKLSVNRFKEDSSDANVRLFSEADEAMIWLKAVIL